MSPFSFLSGFALPSLNSFNAYLPNLPLPENIQQRLVSFVLRRTLGRFVRHEGLLGEKVEAEVASGRITFGRLELDPDAITLYLPSSVPLIFIQGHITSADIQLPFPNLLSAALSISLGEVHLCLGLREAVDDKEEELGVDLEQSVLNVTKDFVSEILSLHEIQDLSASMAPMADTVEATDDARYQTPGGFPVPNTQASPDDAPSTSLLASVVENILARLQVQTAKIIVRLEVPPNWSQEEELEASDFSSLDPPVRNEIQAIDLRLERVSYGPDGTAGHDKSRTIKVGDVEFWMITEISRGSDGRDGGDIAATTRSSGSGSPASQARTRSFNADHEVADFSALLEGSRSMYESALESTVSVPDIQLDLDPFGCRNTSSSIIEEHTDAEKIGAAEYCICSLGESGLQIVLEEARDGNTRNTAELKMGDIQLALSISDLSTLAALSSTWTSRSPFSTRRSSIPPSSASHSVDARYTFASTRIMVYTIEADQPGLAPIIQRKRDWSLPHQTGIELFLDHLSGSVNGGSCRINLDDTKVVWHQVEEETKVPPAPVVLLSLVPAIDESTAREETVHPVPLRPRYTPHGTTTNDRTESGKGLSIEMQHVHARVSASGLRVSLSLPVVEDMLPFIRQVSGVLAQLTTATDKREHIPPRATLETSYWVSCKYISLELRLPLQDRYYEVASYQEGTDRRLAMEVFDLSIHQDAKPLEPSLFFDDLKIYFGLVNEPDIPGICAISSNTPGEASSKVADRPSLSMVRVDGSDPCLRGRLPSLSLWLDHLSSAGLQYLADDLGTWLDSAIHGENLSTRDNIKLVSSRFFGPTSIASPLDFSLDQLESLHSQTLQVDIGTVHITVETANYDLHLHGTDGAVRMDSLQGKESGNVIKLECGTLSGSIHRFGLEAIPLVKDLSRPSETLMPAKPALAIGLTTIQMAQLAVKQTTISIGLFSSAIYTAGRDAWMEEIAWTLRAPKDVFANVVPSDVTKITLSMEEVALIYERDQGGALCFDVDHFRLRTARQHHARNQDFSFKSDEIRLHASDSHKRTKMSDSATGPRTWRSAEFCEVAKLLNLRAKVSIQDSFDQVSVEVDRMDTTLLGCADSLRTTVSHLKALSLAFQSKISASSESPVESKRAPDALRQAFERGIDIAERAFSPDTVRPTEGDLLDDDLPTHQQYLTVSRKGKPDQKVHQDTRGSDGIAIECRDWFSLESDHFKALTTDLIEGTSTWHKCALRIEARNCNLKFELFEGYDWASTIRAIETERKAVRRQLQRIRQVLATGQEPPDDFSGLSSLVFNSIHLGLPEDTAYASPAELATAIESSLEVMGDDLETDGWQELDDHHVHANTNHKTAAKPLIRSNRVGIEAKMLGIQLQYLRPLSPHMSGFDASLDLSAETLEILDNLPSSTWKTFLKTRPAERPNRRSLRSEPSASRCEIRWFGSGQNETSESSLRLNILPVRMHVDQDAIDFIKRFLSFSTPRDDGDGSEQPADSSLQPAQFIQRAEVSPIEIRLDYKPKRIDMNSLRKGHLGELINLFHFEDSKVVLRHAAVRGVSGWGAVYDALLQIWSPDIRANQMSDLVGGAAPVRSLIKVGEGVANLILLPIEQYQKDGRVVKGLQRGGKSFAKTTTLEAIKITSRLATGTQVILEKAEAALRGGSTVPVEVIENDGDVRQSQSRYANQPSSAREGFTQAYSALAHDLGSAAQTILAIPMEVHENAGSGEATGKTVIRAVPLAVVQTMMGLTNASRKTLQGIRNQLDSQVQQQLQEKYK